MRKEIRKLQKEAKAKGQPVKVYSNGMLVGHVAMTGVFYSRYITGMDLVRFVAGIMIDMPRAIRTATMPNNIRASRGVKK